MFEGPLSPAALSAGSVTSGTYGPGKHKHSGVIPALGSDAQETDGQWSEEPPARSPTLSLRRRQTYSLKSDCAKTLEKIV